MENTKTDANTTEQMIIDRGYKQLSGEELAQRIIGKTIRGDYYNGRRYVAYFDENGTMEGDNDIGTHSIGKWSVNMENKTFAVVWDSYWDDWTSRVYDVDGEIQFFDSTTSQWRTTINIIKDGKTTIAI